MTQQNDFYAWLLQILCAKKSPETHQILCKIIFIKYLPSFVCLCLSNIWLRQRHKYKQMLVPTLCINFSSRVCENTYLAQKTLHINCTQCLFSIFLLSLATYLLRCQLLSALASCVTLLGKLELQLWNLSENKNQQPAK